MSVSTPTAIAVAAGHRESVTADNPDYSAFFDLLREEGRRTETLPGRLSAEALADFSALLVGEPHSPFSPEEIAAVRKWVQAGGALLVLASAGGEAAPAGDPEGHSNLSELVGGVTFKDNVLGLDLGVQDGEPFDTRAGVAVGGLLGREGAVLCYDTGCTLSRDKTTRYTLRLPAPQSGSLLHGFRLRGDSTEVPDSRPRVVPSRDSLLLQLSLGQGTITAFGAAWSLKTDTLVRDSNLLFLDWLLCAWLPELFARETSSRLTRPQRHRLLHGYPMAPLMPARQRPHGLDLFRDTRHNNDRALAIGVLPHPFCNPTVKGCGFCTFPHETYRADGASRVVQHVIREIQSALALGSNLDRRRVPAVYIGGGTANLTPVGPFRDLCKALAGAFDMHGAEVTLEGVPRYFLTREGGLLHALREEVPARSYRLSMGIQSFDDRQLQRMGRTAFGNADTFHEVIRTAHDLKFTVSGDLLFNLPGQTLEQMKSDLQQAIDSGLDQVCLYHLVLFDGLGTEWSRDPALLAGLPDNRSACRNWLALREMLLSADFEQVTLTNFERREVRHSERRFRYEEAVFHPEETDWIGFGPSAISLFIDPDFRRAVKTLNAESSAGYLERVAQDDLGWERAFGLDRHDLKVLYLTRKVALLGIDRAAYFFLFGSDAELDFAHELRTLADCGLLSVTADTIRLTPEGMFYADTVAGLLAWRRVRQLRAREVLRGVRPGPERWVRSHEYAEARHFRMG